MSVALLDVPNVGVVAGLGARTNGGLDLAGPAFRTFSLWAFPYERIIRTDDEEIRLHHRRAETIYLYGIKHDVAELAMGATGNKRILEIGMRAGYSAYAFLSAGAQHFVAIDNDLDAEKWGGRRGWSVQAQLRNVAAFPDAKQTLIHADSHDFSTFLLASELGEGESAASVLHPFESPGQFALVHVDGDHSIRGAWLDLFMYSHLVAPGGALLVDGVNWDAGTQIAVGRFRNTHQDWRYRIFETGSYGGDALFIRPRVEDADASN